MKHYIIFVFLMLFGIGNFVSAAVAENDVSAGKTSPAEQSVILITEEKYDRVQSFVITNFDYDASSRRLIYFIEDDKYTAQNTVMITTKENRHVFMANDRDVKNTPDKAIVLIMNDHGNNAGSLIVSRFSYNDSTRVLSYTTYNKSCTAQNVEALPNRGDKRVFMVDSRYLKQKSIVRNMVERQNFFAENYMNLAYIFFAVLIIAVLYSMMCARDN